MAAYSTNELAMTPEAVRAKEEFIADLAEAKAMAEQKGEVVDLYGRKYFQNDGSLKLIDEPKPDKLIFPDPLRISTLDGLVDYIAEDIDGIFEDTEKKYLVRVISPTEVELITATAGYWQQRGIIARVTAILPKIEYGKFLACEEFQIMLQSKFEANENVETLLLITGSISKEHGTQIADDGVSQRVTIKTGVVTNELTTIKNPVALKPFRTFHEITQPKSFFVYRVNDEGNAALFEGDGGAWIHEAIADITSYLRYRIKRENVKVIG